MKFGNLLHMLATHNQQFQVLYAAYKSAKKALKRLGQGQPQQGNPDTTFATELVQCMQELATMKANLQQGAVQRLEHLQGQLAQQQGSIVQRTPHHPPPHQASTSPPGKAHELSGSPPGSPPADGIAVGYEGAPSGPPSVRVMATIELPPVSAPPGIQTSPAAQAAPGPISSPANNTAQQQQSAGDEEEDELHQVYCEAVQFHGELLLIMNWSMLAYTMCLKILKKHNKRTGMLLQAPELRSMLSQPTWSTEEMAQLVCAAEDLVTRIQQKLLSKEQQQQQQQGAGQQPAQVQLQVAGPAPELVAGTQLPQTALNGSDVQQPAGGGIAHQEQIEGGHTIRPRRTGALGLALRAASEQGAPGGEAPVAPLDPAGVAADAAAQPPVVRGLYAPVAGRPAAVPADPDAGWVRGGAQGVVPADPDAAWVRGGAQGAVGRADLQAALSPGVQQGQGLQRLLSNMNTSSWDLSEDDEMEDDDDMEDDLEDDETGVAGHTEDGNDDGERVHVGNIGIPIHYSGNAIQPQGGPLTWECLSYMSASGSCSPPLGTSPMSDDGIQPIHPPPRRPAPAANPCTQGGVKHTAAQTQAQTQAQRQGQGAAQTQAQRHSGEDEATSAAAPTKRSHLWLMEPAAGEGSSAAGHQEPVLQRGARRDRVHATGALRNSGQKDAGDAPTAAGSAANNPEGIVGQQLARIDSGARGSGGAGVAGGSGGSDGRLPMHENNAGMVLQMQLALQAWEFLAHNSSTPSTVLPPNSNVAAQTHQQQQQQQVSQPPGASHGC